MQMRDDNEADQIRLKVLLVDDDHEVIAVLGDYLKDVGHDVAYAYDGQQGLDALGNEGFDVVVTDLRLPTLDGFQVLRKARESSPDTDVIMITGYGDAPEAVRAIREGAVDFLTKPVRLAELLASMERIARLRSLRQEKDRYRHRAEALSEAAWRDSGIDAIIGVSAAINNVKNLIQQVCRTDRTSVLITGETGTGKELVARAIHYASDRADEAFVAVNCTAIPDTLAETELFGHVKGAFTDARQDRAGRFEQADGGALFLDEIGDMSPSVQGRLLRTLEDYRVQRIGDTSEIPVNVRVISATNQNLLEIITERKFREDLYYRLNTFNIHIPPLRERREDIMQLAAHFLMRYVSEIRKPVEGFSKEATRQLESHFYPGNVRELRNLVERAVIVSSSDEITPEDLEFDRRESQRAQESSLDLAENEKTLIVRALQQCGGNQVRAARVLGVSRDTLRRRIDRYGLSNG